jgi:hypothetical protein
MTTTDAAPPNEAATASRWPWPKRFGFCFLFVFLVLSTLPMPFAAIPFGSLPFRWLNTLWIAVVPIVGQRVFHVKAEFMDIGSGDTVFRYVELAVWAIVSSVIACLWSALDHKSAHYQSAHRGLVIFARYALAFSLVSYGASKIIPVQFPRPSLDLLVLPYGSSTRFTLGYAFMGASPWLERLAGLAEISSAILLTIRRTTLFGALAALGILLNVAAFNFFYGVPAKIQVLHLLALAGVIVFPHRRRLIAFLIFNRPTLPSEVRPLFHRGWLETATVILRTLTVTALIIGSLHNRYKWDTEFGDHSPRSPLRGIWNVDFFQDNGIVRPPLVTDSTRWRRLIFDGPLTGTIDDMDDTRQWFKVKLTLGKVTLTTIDEKTQLTLSYARPDAKTLVIDTTIDGHAIHAICHRLDERNYPLTSGRFHWSAETYKQ